MNIGEYKLGLDQEKKEKELINKLREELKVFQQVVVEVKKEEEKKQG